jgi:hypothetical protein
VRTVKELAGSILKSQLLPFSQSRIFKTQPAIAGSYIFLDNGQGMNLALTQNEEILHGLRIADHTAVPTTVGLTLAPRTNPFIESTDTMELDAVLEIQNTDYPVQEWTAKFSDTTAVFENKPHGQWPKIRIQFSSSTSFGRNRVRSFFSLYPKLIISDFTIRPTEDTVEAEVLYTRVFLGLVIAGKSTLRDLEGKEVFSLRHGGPTEGDWASLIDRAKLYRKLRFIETVFHTAFELPPDEITADEVRLTEIIFNGVARGFSIDRGSDITLKGIALSELDITRPPFTGPGEFRRVVSWGGRYVGLFGKTLDTGPVTLILRHAELADPRVINRMKEEPTRAFDLRFVVYDHQIVHRFERYSEGALNKRVQRLTRFRKRLSLAESAQIADLVTESLAKAVSERQAIQIVNGWLYINRFPDRYSPQTPELVPSARCWRVPIYFVYADGRSDLVGEVRLDLQSGDIISHTEIDEIRKKGKSVAEALTHA